MIIAIEGPDGVGKATQAKMLIEELQERGHEVLSLSFPDYESPYGKMLRGYLLKESEMEVEELFHLFLIDMVRKRPIIRNALAKDKVVVINRWFESTVAYESAAGMDYGWAKRIEDAAALPLPDIALCFDAHSSVSMAWKGAQRREEGSSLDRFEESAQIQNDVAAFYRRMIGDGYGAKRWDVIDAGRNVEEVHRSVMIAVDQAMAELTTVKVRG